METKYKIHAFYVLLILLGTIVILLSVKWGDIANLAQYFAFALTLSSLLLALLAIIYSFYSNSSNAQNVSALSGLSNSISQSASLLRDSTQEITQQLSQLPVHLKVVEGKVEETQTLIKELYSPPASRKDIGEVEVSSRLVQRFLERSSFGGLELLYAMSLISKRSQEFDFDVEAFASKTEIIGREYLFGFTVASYAIGIISGTTSKFPKVHVTKIHPEVVDKIGASVNKRAGDQEGEVKENWLAAIAKVEAYASDSSV